MLAPISRLQVDANAFGGELNIFWELPDSLPSNFKVYVFKRSRTDVTQSDIDNYFDNIDDLTGYNYQGLMVFDRLTPEIMAIADMQVLNKETYYYKAVIRDETSGEYSDAVGASGTPTPNIKVNVKDGKDIVAKAIEKMIDSVVTTSGQKVKLNKDIKIVKSFSVAPITDNLIMIERVNGSNYIQFWGNQLQENDSATSYGGIDADVIRATFITVETPDRRDTVANIFRAYKPYLVRLCKAMGADNCIITIEGDYYNPQLHGVNAVGFTVVFNLLLQHTMKVSEKIEVFYEEVNIN